MPSDKANGPDETEVTPAGDYDVGYKKPPQHTQFKPGHSGNRKGRPRGSKEFSTVANTFFNQRVKMREGNKVRSVSRQEALLHKLYAGSMNGNVKDVSNLAKLLSALQPAQQQAPAVTETDERTFEEFEEYFSGNVGQEPDDQ